MILGLVLSIGVAVASVWVSRIIKHNKEKEHEEKWQFQYDRLKQECVSIQDQTFKEAINNLPQITFERFLNLYPVSPEKWSINKYSKYNDNWAVPYYTAIENGRPIYYPIFWTDGKEMEKYYNWLKNVYAKGDSALNLQTREKYLKDLTNYIQEDIKKKREQSEKELAALENQFKKDREESVKKSIKLTLEPATKQHQLTNVYTCTHVGEQQILNLRSQMLLAQTNIANSLQTQQLLRNQMNQCCWMGYKK